MDRRIHFNGHTSVRQMIAEGNEADHRHLNEEYGDDVLPPLTDDTGEYLMWLKPVVTQLAAMGDPIWKPTKALLDSRGMWEKFARVLMRSNVYTTSDLKRWGENRAKKVAEGRGVTESYQPKTLKEDYESGTCDYCDASDGLRDICDWIEYLVDYDDLEWREQQAIDGLCEEGGYVCKKCAKNLINRALRGVEERETGYTEPEFDEMSVDDKEDNPEGWEMPETFQDDNALPEDF